MLDFFESIISYIDLIWNFFINAIRSLISLFTVLLGAVTLPQMLVNTVPSFLAVSVSAVASIALIKLIVGRDQS